MVSPSAVTSKTPVIPLRPRTTPSGLESRSDDELMQLAAAGVLGAFEVLVRRHHRLVRGYCAQMLGDAAAADDAAQEVFMQVWRTCARYQPQGRFSSFLLTCAHHRCLNTHRQRRPPVPVDEQALVGSPEQLDAILAAERMRRVNDAMAQLPPKLREAIALRFSGGLEYRDITRVTGRNEETIRSRVFLGLKRLRAILGEDGKERRET